MQSFKYHFCAKVPTVGAYVLGLGLVKELRIGL